MSCETVWYLRYILNNNQGCEELNSDLINPIIRASAYLLDELPR